MRDAHACSVRGTSRSCVPVGLRSVMRCLARSRHSARAGKAVSEALPLFTSTSLRRQRHIDCQGHAAHPDRIARGLLLGASLQRDRDRPARLHRAVDSSSWSSTSCSTARERTRSRASLSAASITCETSARTSCEICGFHLLSFVSSFSAMASTNDILLSCAT